MMERLNALVAEGNWSAVVTEADGILAGVSAADRARAHLLVSTAYHNAATSGDDWRASLAHARQGLSFAVAGTADYTWAVGKLACLLVDVGRPHEAAGYALVYLSSKAQLPRLTPYVLRAMGDVAYARNRFDGAATWYSRAMAAFATLGDEEQVLRSRLNLVWAFARAGRKLAARSVMPDTVPASLEAVRIGAQAAIAYAYGDWSDVCEYGARATRGTRHAHDFVDAAEVALLVAEAYKRLGNHADAFAFTRYAADFSARQDRDVSTLLLLNQRARGGDSPDAATSRGSSGFHPDACFTTGVA